MNRRTRTVCVIATVASSLVGVGCLGERLLGKVQGTDTVLQGAIADGSKTIGCAPKETAIAEANVRFARDALTMGEYYRGKEHSERAEIYTQLARKKTDPVRCKDPNAVRDYTPGIGDRDGDQYDDKADKCPDDPEDFDSFQDDDGCPDKDNDNDGILDASEFKDGKWTNLDKKIENGRELDCRNEPEDKDNFEDEDGCPDPDNDRDTIPDTSDPKCPNDPEDFDGFEDDDGCPDKDNDGDKVLDAAELIRNPDGTYNWTNNDKMMDGGVEVDCRNRPEDFDGDKDEDGCPDLLKIDNCQIKLSDKIYFKFNKWDIDPRSFKVLDEVKDTLNAAPDIKIWIEGHTDSKGSDKYNKKLSQQRVNSVRDYLVKAGIPSDRLEPIGWGEEKPIADNKSADGRAANRRVEFNLKDCKKTIQ